MSALQKAIAKYKALKEAEPPPYIVGDSVIFKIMEEMELDMLEEFQCTIDETFKHLDND